MPKTGSKVVIIFNPQQPNRERRNVKQQQGKGETVPLVPWRPLQVVFPMARAWNIFRKKKSSRFEIVKIMTRPGNVFFSLEIVKNGWPIRKMILREFLSYGNTLPTRKRGGGWMTIIDEDLSLFLFTTISKCCC
jgi:hypothetical protein